MRSDDYTLAKILQAYLIDGKSHRQIQREILGLPAPPKGGGFKVMEILHVHGIKGEKKSVFKSGFIRGVVDKDAEELLINYLKAEKEAALYFKSKYANKSINPDNRPTTRLSLIKARVYQDKLRELTLENYHSRCALCTIDQNDLLVCSHIIPWGIDSEKRLELDNVINFCVLHDRLFERGYFGFDQKYNVVLNLEKCDSYLRKTLSNSVFKLPQYFKPKTEYL